MSAAVQKPPVLSPTSRSSSVKPSSPSVLNRSPSRASTPTTTGNGISRTRSLRGPNTAALSARASAKRATGVSGSGEDAPKMSALLTDGDARAEAAALMEDLKERLQRAEQASEEYQRQVKVLQSRLDDAHREQGKLEDRAHGEEERAAELQNEKKDLMRQRRELEGVYETERVAATKEKEDAHMREEELQRIIQRLKDDLAQRDSRPGLGADGRLSRTCTFATRTCCSFERFTDSVQRAFEATLPLAWKVATSLPHLFSAATPEATQRCYYKRTSSSSHCDWSLLNIRSNSSKWRTWVTAI